MRLLLLEDDEETANYVRQGFLQDGDTVDHATRGSDALMLAAEGGYVAYIFDRMVAPPDGFKVLTMLRAGGDQTPAIFLTAIDQVSERVEGLAIADDYLVKPFSFSELRARVTAIVRRPQRNDAPTELRAGDLSMDLIRRRVYRAGAEITVLPTEFRLLEYLIRNKGRVVTRTMLLENVWDFHFDPTTNIVETHISRLRSKIDRDFSQKLIHTVRGAGYMLDENH